MDLTTQTYTTIGTNPAALRGGGKAEPEAPADTFGFLLDGKAIDQPEADSDGNLIIEGWAANFEGIDREGENFTDGAFQRGIKSFLSAQRALCFHHKHDQVIGEVLDLEEVEGKGLKMRARVNFQPDSSPLRWIYNSVKDGTLKGLSVGGFFKRKLTPEGYRISDMDFTEISVTAVPVHPGTSFAVVAGKALASDVIESDEGVTTPDLPPDLRAEDVYAINDCLARLDSVFKRLGERGSNDSVSSSAGPDMPMGY